MDREIPSVPITTLAGVASLTDLLPEMPLPTPLPQTLSNKSLLFHPRVAEEAQNLLGVRDEALVPQLVHSLVQTSASHIEVKDHYAAADTRLDQQGSMPELLRAILDRNPNVFSGTSGNVSTVNPQPSQWNHTGQPTVASTPNCTQSPSEENPALATASRTCTTVPHRPSVITEQKQPAVPVPITAQTSQAAVNSVPNCYGANSESSNSAPVAEPTVINNTVAAVVNNCNSAYISNSDCKSGTPEQEQATATVTVPATATASPTGAVQENTTTESLRRQRITRSGATSLQAPISETLESTPKPPVPDTAHTEPTNNSSSNQISGITEDRNKTTSSDKSTNETMQAPKQPVVKLERLLLSKEEPVKLASEGQGKSSEQKSKTKDAGAMSTRNRGRQQKSLKEASDESSEEEEKEEASETPRSRRTRKTISNDDDYVPDSTTGDESPKSHKNKQADEDDTFSALVGSTRKRKQPPVKEKLETPVVKPKLRRVEKEFVPVLEKLSIEELMETNTYHRFNKTVEYVIKNAEDQEPPEAGDGDDCLVQDEHLLSRVTLQELVTEAAKLKSLGATEMIPTDRLVRLLNIMELNIRGGDRVSPISDEDNESIRQMWMETTMERVMGAVDACLVSLNIMTSPNMPKRVYLEDVIDRVVLFLKYQLNNTIFPSFDSTYRLDNKKKDGRKKKSTQVSQKNILVLYNKVVELIHLLAELLSIQVITDTSVLHASSMGVSPFFVENVSELQLACLKLVTTIFSRYEKHRRLLLDDILASIARLPSTKRSLRTYRLNSEEHIQMLTALVLQLIQCVVALPENMGNEKASSDGADSARKVDKDVLICNKYEMATSTAGVFLTVFLSKCGNKSEDIDYRPLFENFVQDLLSTVNKPEWPATELLLSLLGKMLVKNFSNKGTDMSLRVASLDYLGVVAARLRRDGILSHCKTNTIDQMIKDIKSEQIKEDDADYTDSPKKKKDGGDTDDAERVRFLQKVLLDFLAVDAHNNAALRHARHFYIAQWYKDATNEKARLAGGEKSKNNPRENNRSRRDKIVVVSDCSDEEEMERDKKEKASTDQENAEKYRSIETRKQFLVSKIRPFQTKTNAGCQVQVFQTYIDYSSAELITRYLASKRSFSQSFDQYLKAILIVLRETSIAMRTKALKCLTTIVEADPSVLGRPDMQMGVNHSFLDHSTSVREAAVDLVGKFVLSRPELISKYYEMLSARILDTGVSVRKRVIKILKDICIECPDFQKIPEICVKMIRRVNDEEGIRKLVMEVFQNMWFTPTKDSSLLRKVMNITDVVASSKDIGLEWFEQLLLSLFKPKEDKEDSTKIQTEPPKILILSCRQIVDCLIENVLRLDETDDSNTTSQRLVACLTTLFLFAKIRPQLLVNHAITLQPYLSLKCQSRGDIEIISNVARILELVVPLMEHPSQTFLAQLEEDSMKLILQYDRNIVASCLSCLGSIVNNVTRNFKLIRDCFQRFYDYLIKFKVGMLTRLDRDVNEKEARRRPFLRRALYIVGLLLRYFNFQDPEVIGDLPKHIKDDVYGLLSYYFHQEDEDIQLNALQAVGYVCIRHCEFMLEDDLKKFYNHLLMSDAVPLNMKITVLKNIELYLCEEEKRMIQQDMEWSKNSKKENLKEMGDISSGMASAIIQHYLKEILQSYLHLDIQVRTPALKVIQLVLEQGLVHPVQIVPYLICMSTDCEKIVSHSADKHLLEIEKKYPGFIHTKSSLGIRLSYQLQQILQDTQIVRGFRVKEKGEYPSSLNGYLYSILRGARQHRRALILSILRQFDEQVHTTLNYMLYLADNLAYFPYAVQDEPLFIIHNIDIMISYSGTSLLQSFREGLIMTNAQRQALETGQPGGVVSALDEDDEDEEALLVRVPEDTSLLQACLTGAQGCLLLLMLKQHLKDVYGLSEGKIQQYSPSEAAKVYEKNVTRRSNAMFNPKSTMSKLKDGSLPEYLDEQGRRDLVIQYLDFKQLMLKLDPDDVDDEENAKVLTALNSNTAAPPVNSVHPSTGATVLTEADQLALQNYKESTPPKVPKLVISNRRLESDSRRTPRTHRSTEKPKKHRQKKKRRKFMSSSGEDSDYSDPDFMA